MSILIPGKMPTSCARCPCANDETPFCRAANKYIPMLGKPEWCPLIELPPHGRLIDADAFAASYIADMPDAIHELKDKRKVPMFVNQIQALLKDIAEAPTIIPEEGGANDG